MIATLIGILSAAVFTLLMIGAGVLAVRQYRLCRKALRPALRVYGFGSKIHGPVRFL